jgi:hypothetical protein
MPKSKGQTSWKTISLPKPMLEQIETFIASKEGQALGYSSTASFVVAAIRGSPDFRKILEDKREKKE